MLNSKEMITSIEFCENYRRHPLQVLKNHQQICNLQEKPFRMEETQIAQAIKNLDPAIKLAIDTLKKSVDEKNQTLSKLALTQSYQAIDLTVSWKPINNIGVYIPHLLVSSLITWLSAAYAANSERLTVYLGQDPLTGNGCPASIYAAHLFGATILSGPARFAFPCLAFGDGDTFQGSDLICGPAGRRLNILKQVAALLSNKKTDFFAGPSELVIALDDEKHLHQALLDLSAQLEHGVDSIAHLIPIQVPCDIQIDNRVIVHPVNTWQEAVAIIEELNIETVELLGDIKTLQPIISSLNNCGITYVNVSSAMGDYGVVGKGCGDPTQGTARMSSGVTPWLFSRSKVVVNESFPSRGLLEAGVRIAEYEQLRSHSQAIRPDKDRSYQISEIIFMIFGITSFF
jgi:histidinol dehydrogenase